MMLGFLLLYVGAVLFLNGLWLMGKIQDREIVVINLISGAVAVGVVIHDAFAPGATQGSIGAAAITLLFGTTYLWVAWNRLNAVDGRGLGWFSLFVSITLLPVIAQSIGAAQGLFGWWMALNWVIWAVLWFMYFLLLAGGRPILRQTAAMTLTAGVITGWVPGMMILNGALQGT